MRKIRKATGIFMALIMLGCMIPMETVDAAQVESVISDCCRVVLTIDRGTAKCVGKVMSTGTSDRISGTLTLKKTSGGKVTTVKIWNFSSSNGIVETTKTTNISRGSYELVLYAKVVSGNKTETLTKRATAVY